MGIKHLIHILIIPSLITSCINNPIQKETPTKEPINTTTPDTSQQNVIITDLGDTIPTGVTISAKGRWIDPDSVAKPPMILLEGKPKVVPLQASSQRYWISKFCPYL